jgi:hypothetical protein
VNDDSDLGPAPVVDGSAEPVLPVADPPVVVAIDRRTGTVLQALAIGGVVVSLVLMVVAWDFLGDLERNVDQSLQIGEDAAVTLGETIDLAAAVIAAVDSGIVTLGEVLDTVELGLADASDVAASTSMLSATIADSIDDVDVALGRVESLAGTIDGALRAVSRIPLGPDYDPEVSYPQAIADLRTALEPVDAEMRSLAAELDDFATSSGSVGPTLVDLQGDLVDARAALAESDALLERYRVAADEAGALAAQSRDDLESSMWWARFTAVLLGLWIISAQYVPWWLGARSRPASVVALSDAGDSTSTRTG